MATAPAVSTRHIDESSDGQRLDNYLARTLRGVPKSHVYQLIRSGQVRVNGRRARADTRLELDDLVRLPPVRVAERSAPVPGSRQSGDGPGGMRQQALASHGLRLPVIHEADGLIVIDKPAGTAVHGGSGVSSGVIEQLRAARPQARFLELVHRLDRDTSGLLMVATSRRALVAMHDMLRRSIVSKRYIAIVSGQVPARDRTFRDPLSRIEGRNGERHVVADPDGKSALTTVKGLARLEHPDLGPLSLVGVVLGTGRTHQIRVHLADHGWPILGDARYGKFELNRNAARLSANRMYLHARELAFRHPLTGIAIQLRSAWPAAFASLFTDPTDIPAPDRLNSTEYD